MDEELNVHEYRCPLCQSLLDREKWTRITGQWNESKKLIEESKKQEERWKKEKIEITKKADIQARKAAREAAKEAEVKGIAKGITKEKGERIRMTKMLSKQAQDMEASHKTIALLKKQLKEGKTPQTAGFDYEKEVQKLLSETFPEDKIESTGKMGDVLQHIMLKDIIVGKILYECKKTDTYKSDFVKEILRHQEDAKADFAVIVTHAQKKDKSKFFLEGNVLVIDPLGLLDLAILLRASVIDIHNMKLTKEETKQKGVEILRYMQAGEFKGYMLNNIEQAKKGYELLMKEISSHKNDWEERLKIYFTIHQNTQNVRRAIGEILTGRQISASELESFPLVEQEIPLLETGKIIKSNETPSKL